MEEKIIIQSTPYATLKTVAIFALIGVLLGGLVFMILFLPERSFRVDQYNELLEKYEDWVEYYDLLEGARENGKELTASQEGILDAYDSASEYAYSRFYYRTDKEILQNYDSASAYGMTAVGPFLAVAFVIFLLVAFAGIMVFMLLRNLQITVTDRRVYAHTGWWRDSSIPLYAISSVGKLPWQGIVVGSSSCKIVLLGVRNQSSIYTTLNELLMQTSPAPVSASAPAASAPATAPTASAPVSAPTKTGPVSAPNPARTSVPAEAPVNLPPQVAMQAAVQAAVQSASAPSAPPLPTPPSPPTPAPGGTSIGKCTACGKANVPVTTITVTIAGRARTRHLCDECAAKR